MTQANYIPLFPDHKIYHKNKKKAFFVIFFFRFSQAPMLNVIKNDVEIDIFLEPKYHLDPDRVHSRSFLPSKNQINKKKFDFLTFKNF